ncbi:MAG: ABC transporter ATP-binding protein [Chitinophagaceae bacterium]
MSNTVIKVENLSKQYRLGEVGTGTISHDLNRWWAKVRGKEDPFLKIGETNDRTSKGSSDYVWALKDINFDIQQGDAVGIIGRNGAGKSTLLKILSKTTTPNTGSIKIKGRIASLLEVGTGFHPEMTGRENIFLNGAILGMRKKEIARKFDEIVDFAGVERYIDTPVKRYSSGMYVRLAFAVAAHLESEILIVDEVLAVGDAEFQKKCLGKMGEVSKGEGRTVLFVSHNMDAVKTLCKSGILLSNGKIEKNGATAEVLLAYSKIYSSNSLSFKSEYYGTSTAEETFDIYEAQLLNNNLQKQTAFSTKDSIKIYVKYYLKNNLQGSLINFSLENDYTGNTVFLSFDTDLGIERLSKREKGLYEAYIEIPKLLLKPGSYSITFNTGITNLQTYSKIEKCLSFCITLADENESFISYAEKRPGLIAMPLLWETNKIT